MTIRARVSAWLVFSSMAGTTMSFQVFHSIKVGHMPGLLAVLYGIVPLLISMLLIDVISGWKDAPKWIRWAAYLIIGGAMYLSASATGAVVFRAAPNHSSLLFGLLLDGAAILAARYLMTATAKDAGEEAVTDTAEVDALHAALAGERCDREAAVGERDAARAEAAEAAAKAEKLARQLADSESRKPAGSGNGNRPRKAAATGVRAAKVTADLDSYAEALRILAEEPGISASELGRRLGRSESRGRQIMRDLTKAAPQGPDEGA